MHCSCSLENSGKYFSAGHCHGLFTCAEAGKEGARLQAHKEDGFRWWVQRLSRMFQLHDEVRIDHFRGFAGGSICAPIAAQGAADTLQHFLLSRAGSSLCKGLASHSGDRLHGMENPRGHESARAQDTGQWMRRKRQP